MVDFMELVGEKWDRWERGGHRVRAYWYGQPYVHGTAHPGTEYLTQGRSDIFKEITKRHLDGHAFPYIVGARSAGAGLFCADVVARTPRH